MEALETLGSKVDNEISHIFSNMSIIEKKELANNFGDSNVEELFETSFLSAKVKSFSKD